MTILLTPKLTPQVDDDDNNNNKFNEIESSYHHYRNITNAEKLEESELYLNLKQYWQIQIGNVIKIYLNNYGKNQNYRN